MKFDRAQAIWFVLIGAAVSCLVGYLIGNLFISWLLIASMSGLYYRSQLATKNLSAVALKLLRIGLWVSLSLVYTEELRQVLGQRLINVVPAFVIMLIGYFLIARDEFEPEESSLRPHLIGLAMIGLSLTVVSIGLAFYHWPMVLTLPLVWAIEFLIALLWSARQGERAEFIAAVWAIVSVELVWVSSHWLTLYQFARAGIIISQTAILGVALGYSLGGLYFHRTQRKLTRALVFEYFSISAIVFMLILVMTKWTNNP